MGDGDSGELLFEEYEYNWNTVCAMGFDDNAGDVACRQLGYQRSTDVYTYAEYVILAICSEIASYCMTGNFGGEKVWQIYPSFPALHEKVVNV